MLSLGSISHGTLRESDLAGALRFELSRTTYRDERLYAELDAIAHDETRDIEQDSEIIHDAIDALQAYAPPYCYVGFHPGDGSDLGVWFDHEQFDLDCRDGGILKVSDSSELDDMAKEEIAAYTYIAVISDHGNVTLYNVHVTLGAEVLSVV
jgi:hypothetical protein